MDVDEALKKLGLIGKWQILWYTVLTLSCLFPAAWHTVSIVWIGYKPPHHCKLPDNTSEIDKWIPRQDDSKLSSCSMYINSSVNNDTMDCPNGWVFDESISGPTIVTKWNMVCHRAYLADTAQSVMVFGNFLGVLIFSKLSDTYGRKRVLVFIQLSISTIGALSVLPSKLELYYALRFLLGNFQCSLVALEIVMVCEMYSSKDRPLVALGVSTLWGLANAILPLIAYHAKNWVTFELAISLYGFLFIPFFWKLPESVPWLYANNRIKDAEETLLKAAKMNNITFNQPVLKDHEKLDHLKPFLNPLKINSKSSNVKVYHSSKVKSFLMKQSIHKNSFQYSVFDLFKNKILSKHLIVSIFLGFVVNLVYYGLTLTSNSLSGNRYLNGFLNSFIEAPACLITFFFVNRYGRKRPIFVTYVLGGLFLLLTILISLTFENVSTGFILLTSFTMVGKFAITGAFSIFILYQAELFPTNLRVQAIGISDLFSKLGAFLTSYSTVTLETYPNLLLALFGSLAIIAAICLLFMPETHKKALPETIEEIEAWYNTPTLREEAA